MDEQEYDLTVPVNRRDLIHTIEVVTPKADVHLTASIGRNQPRADICNVAYAADICMW